MKTFRLCLALLAPVPMAVAETPVALPPTAASPEAAALRAPPAAKFAEKSEWVFSLLPKSLQKNPNLDLTIITEMTELGKKLPPVSPDQPAYYITQSAGFHQMGESVSNEKSIAAAEVERILTHSLAANGYLPAKPPAHPPSLVIIYTWGSHSLLREVDPENPSLSPEMVARNVLDRAALVGGEKFARHLLELFNEADILAQSASVPTPPDGNAVLGQAQLDFLNPVSRFKNQSAKNEFLVDQAADDIYFVVASAYDYQSVTAQRKKLYWRTRMTVAAQGVSQPQTLPTLIATAAPFLGKDMAESEIVTRRPVPEGRVEIGTPTVVESVPVGGSTAKP
jgi:hypothetical protein